MSVSGWRSRTTLMWVKMPLAWATANKSRVPGCPEVRRSCQLQKGRIVFGRDFARQLIDAGTRAEFYTAARQEHGFFNRLPDSAWHDLVLRQTDLFLASLGYLKGNPTVEIPANNTAALQRNPWALQALANSAGTWPCPRFVRPSQEIH